jgi:hypothetical protein
MGRAARAKVTAQAAQAEAERAAGQRVKLEELPFLRLVSLNEDLLTTEATYRGRLTALQQEMADALGAKRKAFDTALDAAARAAGVTDPGRVKRWDKATCELIVD